MLRPPEQNSSDASEATPDQNYRAAFARGQFEKAAEYLNEFDEQGIKDRLSELGPEDVANLHQGALASPRLGPGSKVARLTRADRPANVDDDPNTVFAGEHFRVKMLDGFSVGEVGGIASGLFAVWDVDNNRRATCQYNGVMLTIGAPVSDGGEGDGSNVFKTPRPVQVDQFGGKAGLAQASASLVGFWPLTINSVGVQVKVPTFFSKSFGIESGGGALSLIDGSVMVFKG